MWAGVCAAGASYGAAARRPRLVVPDRPRTSRGGAGFSVVLSVTVRFPLQIFAILIVTHAPTHAASCLSCLHLAVGLPETLALSRSTEHCRTPPRPGFSDDSCARIPPSVRCRDCLTHSLDDADPLIPPQDHMGNP